MTIARPSDAAPWIEGAGAVGSHTWEALGALTEGKRLVALTGAADQQPPPAPEQQEPQCRRSQV